jgi:hypothetical protein
MKKHLGFLLAMLFASVLTAQQPQTQTAPISALNAKYANGTAPGYWPTAGSGLTLNLSGGTAFCSGSVVTYSAGTLTMTASTTNNVYLNTASSCVPAVKTTAFTSSDIPVAQVVTSGSAITGITDVRTLFNNSAGSGASSPLTTKGDLYGFSTTNARIPVGSNGTVLTADSTAAAGVSYQTPSGGGGSSGAIPFITTTGAVNVMVATFSPAITSLANGQAIWILPNLANTITNPTLNVNGLGAKTVTKYNNTNITVGDLSTTHTALLIYNGTTWELQNPVAQIATGNGSAGAPVFSSIGNPDNGMFFNGSGETHFARSSNDIMSINIGGLVVNGGGANVTASGTVSGAHLSDSSLSSGGCVQAGVSNLQTPGTVGPCPQLAATQTSVNCSTSGTVVFSQPMQGTSYKKVMVYASACNGTASYTYPTAFAHTPQVLSQSLAAIATSLSTSAVTITGLPSTGFLELDGF